MTIRQNTIGFRRFTRVWALLLITGLALMAVGLAVLVLSLTVAPPAGLGVQDGRLSECPGSPNCVSTQTDDSSHWIEPLTFECDASQVIAQLAEIIEAMPRSTIVSQTDSYLHAVFRSRLLRFPDDVEFLVEVESRRVHFRSASRIGHSDLGVNRDRMERIRREFQRRTRRSASIGQTCLR
jgi:uncharacterized protein (DUF1499 family)